MPNNVHTQMTDSWYTEWQWQMTLTLPCIIASSNNEKKRSERCKHCVLAVVRRSQKFRPTADPLPGGVGRPKFNQLETVTNFTYKSSLVKIDARNFELSW